MTTCVGKIKTTRYHTNRYQTLTCYFVGILANCVDTTSLVLGSPIPARSNERIRAARHVPVFGYSSFSRHQSTTKRPPGIHHTRNSNTHVRIGYLSLRCCVSRSFPWHSFNRGQQPNAFQHGRNENEANSQKSPVRCNLQRNFGHQKPNKDQRSVPCVPT